MKQQPNGIRPEEIDKVLAAYGYVPARQKGSHSGKEQESMEVKDYMKLPIQD